MIVVSLLATFFATAAAYRLVADAYLGRPVDPDASLRFGLRRLGSVIWVSILFGLGLFVGLLLLVVPGIFWHGRLVGRDPGAAGREPPRLPRDPALACARAGALVAVCRCLYLMYLLELIVVFRDPVRGRQDRRLERQRQPCSSSITASPA